ncbi:MAG: zinc-ribbon domain-containing protein [Lachnospiraceae bacterium]|uniref:Zinc-ribbon domain-containing protein n=1 Tax=Candidatus Weimeria bifida TaxID=2599074 RepID=A0A6N7J2Q4_9FIRM|nr:zinc-ribbon domain-containing protein [Candidatus Weimeria bifida]RRF96800.1 MAG: zinc-ribbon domain-containing protein [Lachnospiraceae bacterium]
MFENIGNTFKNYGEKVKKSAQNFTETNQLNAGIRDTDKKIEQAFASLGNEFYNSHLENVPPEYTEAFNNIAQLIQHKADLVEQLNKLNNAWKCPRCGASNASQMSFCGNCGCPKPVPTSQMEGQEQQEQAHAEEEKPKQPIMFCPNCGTPLYGGEAFCGNCGYNLKKDADVEATETTNEASGDEAVNSNGGAPEGTENNK